MFTRIFGLVLLKKYCSVAMMKELEKGPSNQALQQSRNVHSFEVLVKRHGLTP